MRSAGTSGKKTKLFTEAVKQSVLNRDANELVVKVQTLGFERLDAFLVAMAVALTRNLAIPSREEFRESKFTADFREKVVDGLAVTFMFNIVNRIANLYDLQPEWHKWRLTESIRTSSQSIMAAGLPVQMPLAEECQEVPCSPKITELLWNFGVDSVSPIWKHLSALPTVEFAIYQLMWIAIRYSRDSVELAQDATDGCLNQPSSVNCHETNRIVSKCCRQLYAEPFKSCEDWSRLELSERTKLDLVLWVALLAAIHQLNSDKIQNLLGELE